MEPRAADDDDLARLLRATGCSAEDDGAAAAAAKVEANHGGHKFCYAAPNGQDDECDLILESILGGNHPIGGGAAGVDDDSDWENSFEQLFPGLV